MTDIHDSDDLDDLITTNRIVVRYVLDGENLHIDNAGLALLFGIDEDEIVAGEEHSEGRWLWATWRIEEAAEHGHHGLGPVLAYYADIEFGAELVLVEVPPT
ncbi:hypothetical protein [Mycobacterium sp. pW045]|uniref:hypothetical protein n=1 Tax=Mycobacterium sp. pW045 TaxID=3238984 RepID=UPI00351B7E6E